MRFVYRRYNDGTFAVIRTENDGSNPETIRDTRSNGNGMRRITTSIDVSFDDNQDGAVGAADGLARLNEVIQQG